jgi:acetyl-CoA carboxylase carboxyl transferase subunit alpha
LASKTVLDFERSIADLDDNLAKLRQIVADRTHPENTATLPIEIANLEDHRTAILCELFTRLTPWDKVLLARHEKRPYTLDYVGALLTDFEELHGDRAFADDGAIVAGLGRLEGMPIAVVGHQKGRDIKQRQHRNFGYARPEGYRKAVRVMKLAEKFGLPVVTLVDTPAAAADVAADERGISEAIARSMYEMSQLQTPIVSVVIGEGGSGGALGIAVADRVLMMEHSIYSVIPPEGCAAILWHDPERKSEAASALKLTAEHALGLGVVDEIIPEPLGGAHRDPAAAAANLRTVLLRHLRALVGRPSDALVGERYSRLRSIGRYAETFSSAEHRNGRAPE